MTDADLAELRAQITEHEGLRLRPYTDTAGKLSIGIGRNLTDKGIILDEAHALFDHDITEVLVDLHTFAWFDRLDSVRQRALADLRFNLGPSRFRGFRKMLDACANSDWPTAADELLDSEWAYQVQPRRRDLLAAQLRTGTA